MKEVHVRGYNRNILGFGTSISPHRRRVGKKGIINWRKGKGRGTSSTIDKSPPRELREPDILPDALPPPLEIPAGKYSPKNFNENDRIRKVWETKGDTVSKVVQEVGPKQMDMFERAEAKIAAFVEKFTNKKYKRVI